MNARQLLLDGLEPCMLGRFRRFVIFVQSASTPGLSSFSSCGRMLQPAAPIWFLRVLMIAAIHSLRLAIVRSVS